MEDGAIEKGQGEDCACAEEREVRLRQAQGAAHRQDAFHHQGSAPRRGARACLHAVLPRAGRSRTVRGGARAESAHRHCTALAADQHRIAYGDSALNCAAWARRFELASPQRGRGLPCRSQPARRLVDGRSPALHGASARPCRPSLLLTPHPSRAMCAVRSRRSLCFALTLRARDCPPPSAPVR